MIGTDLLFIDDAKRKSFKKRKNRLIEKVFSASELNLLNHRLTENKFWLFWCLKETGYKYYQQQTGEKDKINPSAFQIDELNSTKAKVLLPNQELIEVYFKEEAGLLFSWSGPKNLVHFCTEQVSERFPFKQIPKTAFKQLLLKVKKNTANVPYFEFLNEKIFISITHENHWKIISFEQDYLSDLGLGIEFDKYR